jgi:hypothetical protein
MHKALLDSIIWQENFVKDLEVLDKGLIRPYYNIGAVVGFNIFFDSVIF